MKKLLFFILLVVFALFLQTCKKYSDGGNSILKKKKIIGKKVITLYTVDGIDSLKYLEDSVFKCNNYYIDFTKETDAKGGDDKGYYNLVFICNGIKHYPCGPSVWATDFYNISFTTYPRDYVFDYCAYVEENCLKNKQIPSPLCGNWPITKLTWKELWIEQTKNNHNYIVHFEEKK